MTSFESKSPAISLSTKLWGCHQQIKEVESHGVDRINHFAMVGPQASELSTEGTLALEMGSTLEDLLVTIHPHPTPPYPLRSLHGSGRGCRWVPSTHTASREKVGSGPHISDLPFSSPESRENIVFSIDKHSLVLDLKVG